ncbi:expressed unknown protein [Seminavis robusta]|uniref:Uncharacterized protein n=1 Tax=Seminavis robusta TaxID=568900 RepID=A0A9N8DL73_9STRA|nr:expressed unknown protein [Seminavis robusta]|eukprot:Sro191_g082220.1 n/a (189) ;mRNA; f:43216-43919
MSAHDTVDDDISADGPVPRGMSVVKRILGRMFGSCASDPKGSVHRAWGISLLFVVLYFVVAIIEMVQLQKMGGSEALVIAAVWTGIIHVLLAILGTFVLKRFPTSFSIGFLMGIVIVLANQNLILFATFNSYSMGNPTTNLIFSSAAFTLFAVLSFFSLLMFQFKKEVVVSPVDAKRARQQDSFTDQA